MELGRYGSSRELEEHGLVVLAAGSAYWAEVTLDGSHRLLVPAEAAPAVRRQLEAYARERNSWPPSPIADPWSGRRLEILTPLLWCVSVLAMFELQARSSWLTARGLLDATATLRAGEIWRPATALFLHGDAAHVLSNALMGLIVFTAVSTTLGRLRGWLLVLAAAVAANLLAAAVHLGGEYRSLGSSTAIFAGVGVLSGRAARVVARSRHPHRWRALFAPVAAGLIVLGLYGAGGSPRVDVLAHATGFLAGLIAGFIAGLPRSNSVTP